MAVPGSLPRMSDQNKKVVGRDATHESSHEVMIIYAQKTMSQRHRQRLVVPWSCYELVNLGRFVSGWRTQIKACDGLRRETGVGR